MWNINKIGFSRCLKLTHTSFQALTSSLRNIFCWILLFIVRGNTLCFICINCLVNGAVYWIAVMVGGKLLSSRTIVNSCNPRNHCNLFTCVKLFYGVILWLHPPFCEWQVNFFPLYHRKPLLVRWLSESLSNLQVITKIKWRFGPISPITYSISFFYAIARY